MEVELKTDPEMFQDILDGKKKFEIRLADKNINEEEVLVLLEKDKKTKKLTGRKIKKKVKFVLKTKDLDYFSDEDIKKYGVILAGFD